MDRWQEIYIWIESYSGCTYDIDESIAKLKDPNIVFVNKLDWKLTMEKLIDDLSDIWDIIEEHEYLIPDELPDGELMKQMFRDKIIGTTVASLNDIKRQLHIQQSDIGDYRVIQYQIDLMYDLIDMLSSNDMDTIIQEKLFDRYEEQNEDALYNTFGITKEDLSNMHDTITSVIEEATAQEEDGFDA